MSDLLDGLIGGLGGGVLVGAAQMWTYALDKRKNRHDIERQVIPDLLADLSFVDAELPKLRIVESPPDSPLSYSERMGNARPLLDRMREASAQRVPLLKDADLREQFGELRELCAELAGPKVRFDVLGGAVKMVADYVAHLQKSLQAAFHGEHLPPRATPPELPTRR